MAGSDAWKMFLWTFQDFSVVAKGGLGNEGVLIYDQIHIFTFCIRQGLLVCCISWVLTGDIVLPSEAFSGVLHFWPP